jgi:uncharacterized protein
MNLCRLCFGRVICGQFCVDSQEYRCSIERNYKVIIFKNEFEWDEEKAAINFQKHGVSFEEAATIFRDFGLITRDDEFHSKAEPRELATGYSFTERLLTVIFTERSGRTRIISARESTSSERKIYESGT